MTIGKTLPTLLFSVVLSRLNFFNFCILDLVFKSLEIHTVHGRKIFHTWEECEKLIQSGAVKPGLVMKNYCHPTELPSYGFAIHSQR